MSLVIDFHVHMAIYENLKPWVYDFIRQNYLTDDPYKILEKYTSPSEMDEFLKNSGVDYAVMLPETSPITTGISSTEKVLEFCRESKRVLPFATVNPFLVANPAKQVEHYVRELGCKGIKLYPSYQNFYPNDHIMYPVYSKAAELGVPVVFHTGSSIFKGSRLKYSDPLFLDDVAVDFPEMTIVMAHSGRGFWYDRAFFLSRLHKNVYMEIAGLPPQNLLSYFPELEKNSEKVIYGSDWPSMLHIKRNIEMISDLPLKNKAKENILGRNAAKILGIGDKVEVTS